MGRHRQGREGRRLPGSRRPSLRRLVDISAWVEWLIGSATGKIVADAIPAREDWLVPTIVQLELAKWLTREAGEDKANSVLAFTQTCHVAPLDTAIALSAAELPHAQAGDGGGHRLRDSRAAWHRPLDLRRALRRAGRRCVHSQKVDG
ncbi:MAG: PIN domain-containing protein [Caulobacteraceae bacterium]